MAPTLVTDETLANQMLYLLNHPNQLFCHPCLTRLAEVCAKLGRTDLDRFSGKLFFRFVALVIGAAPMGQRYPSPNFPVGYREFIIRDLRLRKRTKTGIAYRDRRMACRTRGSSPRSKGERIAVKAGKAGWKTLTRAGRLATERKADAGRWGNATTKKPAAPKE